MLTQYGPFRSCVKPKGVWLAGVLTLLMSAPTASSSQWQQLSFSHEGLEREYWVFLPQNFEPNMPVVVSLHGRTESFEWYRDYTLLNQVADTAGFVLVYPRGYMAWWNCGVVAPVAAHMLDDVGFIARLIDTLHVRYAVDRKRVYCCGFSLGGHMTFRLACEIGDRFAAVASVAGVLSDRAADESWTLIRPIPLLHIHGTLDMLVWYDGNRPDYSTWSVARTLDFWIENYNCVTPPDTVWVPDTVPSDNCTVAKVTWASCSDSSRIVHYMVINGGHSWPGSAFTFGTEGNKNRDMSANAAIWDFFKQYDNPLVSSIDEEQPGCVPADFALSQNYPNPFNPSTTIRYTLPMPSVVRLSVFDVLGRAVSVLVDEKREVGIHEVKFDASTLSSGVYFYRLKAGEYVQTRTMVLTR